MRTALKITAHEAIFIHADVESGGAGVFDRRRSVFLDQGMPSQDAADASLCLPLIDQLGELAAPGSRIFGAPPELRRAQREFLGAVFLLDAIPAPFLAQGVA